MVLRYWEKERPSVAWWQRACSNTIRRPENTLVGSSWVKNGRKQMGHTDAAVPTMHTQTRDARLTILRRTIGCPTTHDKCTTKCHKER